MITKINSIDNFGVFDGFRWNSVVDKNGKELSFGKCSILYGRNYSGKTTLSRILRALETRTIPDKFENPLFEVVLSDGTTINQATIDTHNLEVRVFNEDFVRANLQFLSNPDGEIAPFAILGENNAEIEKEIDQLEAILGSAEIGNESGLYKQYVTAQNEIRKSHDEYETVNKDLNRKLADKATGRERGIKYNTEKFGAQVQNYNIANLRTDITLILAETYKPLTVDKRSEYENIIREKTKNHIPTMNIPNLLFEEFCQLTQELLNRKIGTSSKIQELLLNTALNEWVKKGAELLNGIESCAFCGNPISNERWKTIHAHFDEESEKLEKEIDLLIVRIEGEKEEISKSLVIDKALFYSNLHQRLDELNESFVVGLQHYIGQLDSVIEQLKLRKTQITVAFDFTVPPNISKSLIAIFQEYNSICENNNDFSNNLGGAQKTAQQALRLHEVADFCATIEYVTLDLNIRTLEGKKNDAEINAKKIEAEINSLTVALQAKRRQLNNEEEGARQVNKYLREVLKTPFCSPFDFREEFFEEKT